MRLLWLAGRNLGHSPRRTGLLALGLGVAVAVALLFFGFTRHSYDALAEVFARSGQGHLQVAAEDWFDSAEPERHRRPVTELQALERALGDRLGDRVLATTIRRDLTGMVMAGGRSGVFLGLATDPASDAAVAPLSGPAEGQGLASAPDDGVLLGAALAERIGVGPGELVTVLTTTDQGLTNGADFLVVGVTRTGVRLLDRTVARFPLQPALDLTGADQADALILALHDTDLTDQAVSITREVLAEHPGYGVRAWHQQAHYYRGVKALYDRLFGVFQALILAVAGLGLSHAVAAVVAQRRAEIALLRVIGLTGRQVFGLFLLEGALLGLLGAGLGVLLAYGVAALTATLGGIPMPPPPGFAVGYDAQFHLARGGFLVVVPTAVLTAMLASGLPALRASRGALSRGLMATAVLCTLVPGPAWGQSDPLARFDAARALPADQLCTVDLAVTEGGSEVRWELLLHAGRSLGRTVDQPASRAQVVLHDGDGTWFQTASMGRPLAVGGSQRLAGSLSLGQLLARPLGEQWEVERVVDGTLHVRARQGAGGPYASAELDFVDDRPSAARFAGPSGRVVRTAAWAWSDDGVRVELAEARGSASPTVLVAARPRCEPGALDASPDQLRDWLQPTP